MINLYDILANIDTALNNISQANGYYTDVQTISRVLVPWQDVPSNHMPWVGVLTDKLIANTGSAGPEDRLEVPIWIVAHITATDEDDKIDKLAKIENDIYTALNVDVRRGNNAIETRLIDIDTDIGDPDCRDTAGYRGTLVCQYRVNWYRDPRAGFNLAPVLQSAETGVNAADPITLTFNYTLASAEPATTAFAVTINGTPATISDVTNNNTTCQVNTSEAFNSGDTILISYTAPGSNPLKGSSSGRNVYDFTNQAVTNNVTGE